MEAFEYECQLCSRQVAKAKLLRCPGCEAIYFCSQKHLDNFLAVSSHAQGECDRMKQQVERGERLDEVLLGGLDLKFFHESLPWKRYANGRANILEVFLTEEEEEKDNVSPERSRGVQLQFMEVSPFFNLVTEFTYLVKDSGGTGTDLMQGVVGWSSFYESRGIPMTSPVCLALHTVLTLLQFSRQCRLPGEGSLNIHVLGVDEELTFCPCFAELSTYFRGGRRINVVCAGPSVPKAFDKRSFCVEKQEGERYVRYRLLDSKDESLAVHVQCHKGFYHDLDLDRLGRPHLVLAQNAGLAAYMSWLPTVKLVLSLRIPFLLTDYCEEAAIRGFECLEALGATNLMDVKLNAFRQPVRRINSDNRLPSWSNGFCYGIRVVES